MRVISSAVPMFGWAGALLLLALAGCGGGGNDQPELGLVTGVVKYQGQPLASARIDFLPTEGRPSVAITGPDGRYSLTYLENVPGARVGMHSVTIVVEPGDADAHPNASAADPAPQIPAKYNTQTTLSREVKAGEQSIDFDLP